MLTLDTKIIARPGDEGSFYDPIKKNKLDFFQQKPEPAPVDFKQNALNDDYYLFTRLFISSQSRECDLLEFFHYENQSFPVALSDVGKLHSRQKSLLASILEAKIAVLDARPEASAIIVDGSALINAL